MPEIMKCPALQLLAALALAWVLSLGPSAAPAAADTAPIKQIGHIELLKTINAAKGKVVVVNFFASWCQPCKMEIPGLIDLRSELPQDDLLLVGISVDEDMRALENYIEQTPFNYPVYHGDLNVARVFQVTSLPKMLIYNKRGGLVVKHDGFVPKAELGEVLETLLKQ